MKIVFECSNCRRMLRVAEGSHGRNARCPQCKTVQKVPEQSDAGPRPEASGGAVDWSKAEGSVETGASGHGNKPANYNAGNSGYPAAGAGYSANPPANPYNTPPRYPGDPTQGQGPNFRPVSGPAVASLVCGALSLMLVVTPCCGVVSIPLALAGGICGVVGLTQTNSGERTGRGIAIGGIICSVLTAVGFFGFIAVMVLLDSV